MTEVNSSNAREVNGDSVREEEEKGDIEVIENISNNGGGGSDGDGDDDVSVKEVYTHEERKLLGSRPPLQTVLFLSIGPIVTQLVSSFQSFVDSLYVAKAIGSKGVEVFGAVYVVEFLGLACAQFLMAGLSVRLSYLYGAKKVDECSQLYVDFIRFGMIFGVLIPCVVLPCTRPIVEWFGAGKELSWRCFQYMIPNTCLSFFYLIYMISSGVIQAEGQSIKFAVLQVLSFILNLALFDPLFLLGLGTETWGASLATVLSQGIVGIGVTIAIFRGKFMPKPKLEMLCKPFSSEAKIALKMGISTLVENLSLTFPVLLMQKYVNLASSRINQYDNVLVVWAINEKCYLVVGGVCVGFAQGYLMAASYANGAGRYNRFLWLTIHALWCSTLCSTAMSLVIVFAPRAVSSLWTDKSDILDIAEKMIPILFYTSFLLGVQYIAPASLQAMKKIGTSSLLCFLTLLVPMPLFSSILYFTSDGKTNPSRIFFTYPCNDIFSLFCCGAFLIFPMRSIWKSPASEGGGDAEEEDSMDKKDEEEENDSDVKNEPRLVEEL